MKLNKKQAEEKIEDFFKNINGKKQEEIRKIKRLAMHHNIKLKEKKKLFCKYCYSTKLRVLGIKNKIKSVECENCGRMMRWKIKTS